MFEGTINPYLTVSGPSTIAIGTLAVGECRDVYFNVAVTRTKLAINTVQRYSIQVTTAEAVSGSTPQPRQLFIEGLVSQGRNEVVSVTGPTTVYVGETYTYTLIARTATDYEQLETFLTLDGVIFQVLSTTSTYSSPAGATSDKLYADACGLQLDPTLPNYKKCVGPEQYTGGKVGGTVTVTYEVKVLSTGPTSLVPLILDMSGVSFHYNSDFGAVTGKAIEAEPARADLSVTKVASTTTPTVGSNVTFTVGLANGGPTPATGIQVRDLLPAGLTYVGHTAPAGSTYDPLTGIWAVSSIAVDASTSLSVTATVTGGGTLVNTAEVVASSVPDPDSTVNNGVATEDDQASVILTPARADLSLTKSVDNPNPNVGQQVTYTVTVTNSTPSTPATNVQVRDVLPAGVTFVSATASAGAYDAGTGLWTVGTVASGTPHTLTIVATVTAAGPIVNTAQVQAADQSDPDSVAGNSNPAEDDESSATVSARRSDLSLSKAASTLSPNVGSNVAFTVGVTNTGPDAATNLTVRDLLPSGLAFVSASPSQGSYSAVTGAWFVGSVANGGSATLTVVTQVTASTPVVNTAQVQSVDQFDPDGTDNSATVTVTPQRADLSVTKSASTATPNVDQTMTFTVAVTNAATGNAPATNVVVADAVPAGTSFVSASATSGSYASGTGLWTVGSVAVGATATLTMTVLVTGSTPFTNTAQVQSVDQFDPNSTPGNGVAAENDQASVTVTPQRADLSVTASVDDPSPNVGDQVVFTITVANAGPSAATGVTVDVVLPAGLTSVSSSTAAGSYDAETGIWTIGDVPSGGSVQLQLTSTVDTAGTKELLANLATADQFDPDSTPGNAAVEDDRVAALAVPQEADLSVTVLAESSTVPVGGDTTFTVSLTNGGPDLATAVAVAAPVPAGSTLVSATPSAGTYDPVAGVWSPGDLPSGTTATLSLTVTVVSPTLVTLTAEVADADQHDPDSAPADGVGDDAGSASVVGVEADLRLTQVVSSTSPNVGESVTFTVTVTNDGPTTATGVSVFDLLPAGLTLQSATASQGSYASGTGLWTVGTLVDDGSATLTIVALVAPPVSVPGAVTVTAEVWTSDLPDPDSAPANGAGGEDDVAAVTLTPRVADLSVSLTVADDRPNVGDTASFTVTVANAGPDPATGVTVLVPLPADPYGEVTATPSQGTYDAASGVWTVGTVAPGAAPTLVLDAAVASSTASIVVAEVQTSAVYDPDSAPGNGAPLEDDRDVVGVSPRAADLDLGMVVGSPTVDLGDAVTFTLTLTNDGPDAATSVAVTDELPAGLTFVSAVAGAGTSYDPLTGVWSVPSLASGSSISLALTVVVASTGPLANVAAVSDVDQLDPDSTPGPPSPSEDDTASETVTGRAADVGIAKTAPASVAAVQLVTYTITVTNAGPSAAEDVVVTDVLPPALVAPSTSSPGCVIASGTMTCAVGAVAVGETVEITVSGTAPATGDLSNTATISSSTPDLDPSDDSSTVAVAVADVADLRLAKTGPASVRAGEPVGYTLTVTNDGPSTATGVVVTDPLPSGIVAPSTSSAGCVVTGSGSAFVLTCSLGSLADDESVAVSVAGTAPDEPGSLVNTASLRSSTVDPDDSDDTATVTTTVTGKADLSVSKSAPLSVVAGGALTYVIVVANAGPSTAEGVVVVDELPEGFEDAVVGSPSSGCVVGAGSVLTCDLGDLPAGASVSVSVTGSAAASGPWASLDNTARVSSTTYDPDPADDSSSVSSSIVPTLVVGDLSVVEGDAGTVPVTLSNPSVAEVTFTLSTADGTAVAPGDYVARAGVRVTIPAGSTGGSFLVATSGDLTDEPSESFLAVVDSGSVVGAAVADDTGVVTIVDNDGAPVVSVAGGSAVEGTGVAFTVSLSNPSSEDVSVTFTTSSGSAVSGVDFTAASALVTIPAGMLSAEVVVPTSADDVDELTEAFTGSLSSPSGAATVAGGGGGTATGSIVDDSPTPAVSVGDATVLEGGTATVSFTLSNPSSSTITVGYTTTTGTAGAGDFTSETGTVTFVAGVVSQSVTVDTTADDIDEAAEVFAVDVTSISSNAATGDGSGAVTITDDSPTPAVSVGDATVLEGGTATVSFTLSNPSASTITVGYTTTTGTAGAGDFTSETGTVTFVAGVVSQSVTVDTTADDIDEAAEVFAVDVTSISSNAATGDGSGAVTITDDSPTPAVSVGDATVLEGGTASVTFTLSNPSASTITVGYTTATGTAGAGDFTSETGTVTFLPGETSQFVTVDTTSDDIDETAEVFTVDVTATTNAATGDGSADVTITDDTPTPSVTVADTTVVEGATATVTFTLSNPSSTTITVSYATTAGTAGPGDFAATTGTVTFLPGQQTQTVDVVTIADATAEPTEAFTVDVTSTSASATVADGSGDVTILDDDATPELTIGDVTVVEGADATFTLTLSNPTASDVTVVVSTVDGSATGGGTDYTSSTSTTVTIPAGQLTATVTVPTTTETVDEVAETFRLVVQSAPNGATTADGDATATIEDDDNTVEAVDDAAPTNEDVSVIVPVLANDLDVDGDLPLTVVGVTQPSGGAAVVNPDGTITFTPAPDTHGAVTFTYTVRDRLGAEDTATVTITVGPVDDPPVAAPDRYAVPANATTETPATTGTLANDTDLDGDALTAELVTAPAHGTLVLRPDGSFEYRPDQDHSGPDSFTYRAVGAGTPSAIVTVTLDVGPVALADTYTTAEGVTLAVPATTGALANDRTGGAAATVELVSGPARGAVALAPDGSFTYVPAPGTSGPDTFTYRTCVAATAMATATATATACSAPATITIDVTPALRLAPPVATDDTVTADDRGGITIPVLTNDADADAALDPSRVTIVSPPAHGTVTVLPNGQIRYQADDGFSGSDSFVYRLCDAAGQCDEAVVDVLVLGRVVAAPTLPVTGAPLVDLARLGLLLLLLGALLVHAGASGKLPREAPSAV